MNEWEERYKRIQSVVDMPDDEFTEAVVRRKNFMIYGETLEQIRLLKAYYDIRELGGSANITRENVFKESNETQTA